MAEGTKLSRRATLQILGAAPALAALFSACGGGKSEPESCSDVGGLSEPEKMARSALQYADQSPQPDKHCRDCHLFVAAPAPSQCGSCQVVKGPIHPNGYCTAWAKKV
ncbi:MAG: high-potential iron-sulfur protein [Myxococcales bacterium]